MSGRATNPQSWTDLDDVRAALAASPVEAGRAIRQAREALRWQAFRGPASAGRAGRELRAILSGESAI